MISGTKPIFVPDSLPICGDNVDTQPIPCPIGELDRSIHIVNMLGGEDEAMKAQAEHLAPTSSSVVPPTASAEEQANGDTSAALDLPNVPGHEVITRRGQFSTKRSIKDEKAQRKADKEAGPVTQKKAKGTGKGKGKGKGRKAEKGEIVGKARKARKPRQARKGRGKGGKRQAPAQEAGATKRSKSKVTARKMAKVKKASKSLKKQRTGSDQGVANADGGEDMGDLREVAAMAETALGDGEVKGSKNTQSPQVKRNPNKAGKPSTKHAGRSSKQKQDAMDNKPRRKNKKGNKVEKTQKKDEAKEPVETQEAGSKRSGASNPKKAMIRPVVDEACRATCHALLDECYYHGGCFSEHDDLKVPKHEKVQYSVYWTRRCVGLKVDKSILPASCRKPEKDGKLGQKYQQVCYFSGGPCAHCNLVLAERWVRALAFS